MINRVNLLALGFVCAMALCSCGKEQELPNTESQGWDPVLKLGQLRQDTLDEGERLLFEVDVQQGHMYKVTWFDQWFTGYTANSIYVGTYKSNKTNWYTESYRLIQMGGSPRTFIAEDNGKAYFRVVGYDENTQGTFGIVVNEVDLANAQLIPLNDSADFNVPNGGVTVHYVDVIKDSSYTIEYDGSNLTGANGSQVEVHVSGYYQTSNDKYFEREWIGWTNSQTFTATKTERIYLVCEGAYWWNPRGVQLQFKGN